ncbi:HEAT repeat [Singulisphaera sp. GP187]|uniref:polymorphic toxin-type HINT domain-containing protein n=1 Tax=Singulisphaera sp. GP187 TaxID=1882752 RepID=UPI000926E36B|nr:polymorphic toxin-type HINT domain-containing protein [Singulisphaera sp. GP187]SIO43120.1 HEAT repeat [Singulisphaera sp. GP187]
MLAPVLVGSVLLLTIAADQDIRASHFSDYEAARANVGRDPDAHVRLALWCEAHGLQAERLKHLAIAVIANPRHSLARGLMGLVEYRGRWQRPESIGEGVKNDALLAEYRDRRAKTKDDPDAQWSLALWCDEHGLKAEAAAHFTAVVKHAPHRDAAWKRLGFKKQGQRWVTEARLAEEKAEADRQKQADRHWKPVLEKWRDGLGGKSAKRRAEVETALAELTDPRAVPALWAVFATGNAEQQAVAVRALGHIDALAASRSLAMLAGFSDSAEVRRTATETLKRRDPREYADILIKFLRDPIQYKTQTVGGPGMPGTLFIAGERKNIQRQYVPPPMPRLNMFNPASIDVLTYDVNGLPMIVRGMGISGYVVPAGPYGYVAVGDIAKGASTTASPSNVIQNLIRDPAHAATTLSAANAQNQPNPLDRSRALAIQGVGVTGANPAGQTIQIGQAILETQNAAASLQQQLESDVAALERSNAETREQNGRIGQLLNEATGQDLAANPSAWQGWWIDQLGYAQKPRYEQPKPTYVEVVSRPLPPVAGFEDNENGYVRRISCFGAGTPVHTLAGIQPIESLNEGDRVLTQNLKTGALGYQPILVVHRNPPSPTYRIALGDETVISSHFHRFWKAGQGWVMARDLAPGDTVRTLGGLVRVKSIDPSDVQPVFNLDVADDADFFVGRQGALVHDNTLPALRQAPFDAPPSSLKTSTAAASLVPR